MTVNLLRLSGIERSPGLIYEKGIAMKLLFFSVLFLVSCTNPLSERVENLEDRISGDRSGTGEPAGRTAG